MSNIKQRQPIQNWTSLQKAEVKPRGLGERADLLISEQQTKRPMFNSKLMEDICKKENLQAALKRVCRNKGAAGIDGMTVDVLPAYLKTNWLEIKSQLFTGKYCQSSP